MPARAAVVVEPGDELKMPDRAVGKPSSKPKQDICRTDGCSTPLVGHIRSTPIVGRLGTTSTTCPEDDQSPLPSPTAWQGRPDSPSGGSGTESPLGSASHNAGSDGSPCSSPTMTSKGERSKLMATLPPAIAEEQSHEGDEVPQRGVGTKILSRGSSLHEEGTCSPCVWHWKPQGCHRGKECGYCHLCPEGEIKNRKKVKLATYRASSTASLSSDAGGKEEEEEVVATRSAAEMVATPGSDLHGTGECRPCAWFYKPQGCQNGAECRHCHLCPEGEIKARKKNRPDVTRTVSANGVTKAQGGSGQGSAEGVREIPSPLTVDQNVPDVIGETEAQSSLGVVVQGGVGVSAAEIPPPPGLLAPKIGRAPTVSVGASLHGTGECRPCAWYHKPQGCQNGAECRHCHMCPEGEIKLRRKQKPAAGDEGEDEADGDGEAAAKAVAMLPLASRSGPPGPLPSPGSALHGTGECRPCGWFHKPQGCANGAECRHCHLCPEGEIRERRKNKAGGARSTHQEHDMERALWMVQKQQEAMILQAQAAACQWEMMAAVHAEEAMAAASPMGSPMHVPLPAAASMAAASAAASMAAVSGAATLAAATAAVQAQAMMEAASPLCSPVHISLSNPFGLPSAGSSLHALGKCRPCAWFYKPQGCQNGQACAHCHLCPEGALKERKRVKEVVMRMGSGVAAAISAGSSPKMGRASTAPTRTARVVKLSSCLV